MEADDRSLANKKMIFIIDEAHRTTMGGMMGMIKDYFYKNGLFFGFTGTLLMKTRSRGKLTNAVS